MENDVATSRIPDDVLERWKTVRDFVRGDQYTRTGGYIPTLNSHDTTPQNNARNKAYAERAVLYNATAKTLQGLIGVAFKKAPVAKLPKKLQFLLADADGAGNSIFQQSQSVVANVIGVGRHGLYSDFDEVKKTPVIKSYPAESIINWRFDGFLMMVVLSEVAEEVEGFGINEIEQFRELAIEDGFLVSRIWRKESDGEYVLYGDETFPSTPSGRLDYIPFVFVGSVNNDHNIDTVPLYDLARLNAAHYRNSADYEDSVFFVGQAQPWISGLSEEWRDHMEKERIYIGSRAPMLLPEGGAFGFAQSNPNTLAKEAMDQKEAQMVALGARLLDKNAVQITATQSENEREMSISVMSLIVSNVNEAYQQAIYWAGLYVNVQLTNEEKAEAYQITEDFSRLKLDPQTITALTASWQSGMLPKYDIWAYLRRDGFFQEGRTDELIQGDIETDNSLGLVGLDEGQ
jgi:hypothetical protein